MAPEVYFADPSSVSYTVKCDIWSIGILLHEMLYHIHPFGTERGDFKNNRRVRIRKRFGVLDEIIEKCLRFSPKRRINWVDFMTLFRRYIKDKSRYVDADVLPINAESMIYEDRKYVEITDEE
jgi:serine/threonine protein kinase